MNLTDLDQRLTAEGWVGTIWQGRMQDFSWVVSTQRRRSKKRGGVRGHVPPERFEIWKA